MREQALGALFYLAEDSESITKVVFDSLGAVNLAAGLKSERRAIVYYSAGLMYHACRRRADRRFEFITAGADTQLVAVRPISNRQYVIRCSNFWIQKMCSTDVNIRYGVEHIADMFHDALYPGPVTPVALAQ